MQVMEKDIIINSVLLGAISGGIEQPTLEFSEIIKKLHIDFYSGRHFSWVDIINAAKIMFV